MPDPIDDFMALPKDQQLGQLQKLAPERQAWLLDQIKQRHGRPAATVSAAPSPYSWQGIKDKAVTLRDQGIRQLPTIGGIIGGFAGGASGAETGPGIIATSAAGSAMGGGFGEMLRQRATEHFHPEDKKLKTLEGLKKAGVAGLEQGGSELVAGSLGRWFAPSLGSTINKLFYSADLGPKTALEEVMPEIFSQERLTPATTVQEFMDTVKTAKQKIGTEVDTALRTPVLAAGVKGRTAPLASTPADVTPVADQIKNLINAHPSELQMNPARTKAIQQRVSEYATPKTYGWLNDRRIVLNDELNKFYALKTPSDQALYLSQHPYFEIDKAEADAIRDVVYPQMDRAAGKPAGYFEKLQQKRGILKSVENQTREQIDTLKNKSMKSKGAPLLDPSHGYLSTHGNVGMSLHPAKLLKKDPLKAADKQVARAFVHTPRSKVGKILGTKPGQELMSLPLRELFTPDSDQP